MGLPDKAAFWLATNPKVATTAYVFGTGVALGNPATRSVGKHMFSYGVRAGSNFFRGALFGSGSGFFGTPFVRGGTLTAGRALASTAAVGAGYILGAAVGSGISWLFWGEPGRESARDFYSFNLDHWYEYTVHYNAYRIVKHHFFS